MPALPKIAFVGPLVRAAIATLSAQMPGQVAAFNAEPANTVVLVAPATFHFGGNDLLSAFAFPQCEVAAVTGDLGNFTIARATADHDVRCNVSLWIDGADGGGDIPTLYEQAAGLARCAIECLTPTGAFGVGVEIANDHGVSWRIDVVPFDPTAQTPSSGRNFQRWLGSALLQFRVEPIEAFS